MMNDDPTAREVLLSAVRILVEVAEAKDDYFAGYMRAVERLAVELARVLELGEEAQQKLRVAAILKDIGRIGLQDAVINKRGRLSASEQKHIQSHVHLSEKIVAGLFQDEELCSLVRHHHEWYDGMGYPDGLAGERISLGARILGVADAFVAMTQDRSYRSARTVSEALHEISAKSGSQFCPTVVASLLIIIHPELVESDQGRASPETAEDS